MRQSRLTRGPNLFQIQLAQAVMRTASIVMSDWSRRRHGHLLCPPQAPHVANTYLDDARVDWSAGRVPPKVLTCDARMEWFNIFRQFVAKGEEVDLVSFNQDYDANIRGHPRPRDVLRHTQSRPGQPRGSR